MKKNEKKPKKLEFQRLPIERQNEIKRLIANNPTCSICLDEFEETDDFEITKCDHLYHLKCIEDYVKATHNNKCPMCRTNMETGEPEFVQPAVVGTRRQRIRNNLTRRFRNLTRRPRTWLQQGYRAYTRRRNRRRQVTPRIPDPLVDYGRRQRERREENLTRRGGRRKKRTRKKKVGF